MIETWAPLGNGHSHWSYHLSVVIGHKSISTVMVILVNITIVLLAIDETDKSLLRGVLGEQIKT